MVTTTFTGSAWMTGIAEVCTDIENRGEHSTVIAMSPDPLADQLRNHGFDAVVATRFPLSSFTPSIDPEEILMPTR